MSGDIQTRSRRQKFASRLKDPQTRKATPPPTLEPEEKVSPPKSSLFSTLSLGFIATSFFLVLGLLIQRHQGSGPSNGALLPNLQGLPDNIYAGASSLMHETSSLLSSLSKTLSSIVKPSENEILSESDRPIETQIESPLQFS
eukprot:TRINITY_DN26284_c0_g1_i1.p1 TRINITY_DN26284_c0_g1~~TRINITY_DN26284_c0_g1_i1.p1  ORF type:complete len:143 (-),score=30.28 TRINITY_DN26284_c0_g1_i1:72-500(-)